MKPLKLSFASILRKLESFLSTAKNILEKSVNRNKNKQPDNHPTEPSNSPYPKRAELEASTTQPSTKDEQWHEEQKRFWERQIRCAKALNVITICGTVAALWGLFILYGTLEVTRIAANASRDQADAAKRAVILAERSFDENVNIFLQDQRAWVGMIEAIRPAIKLGIKPTFSIVISNTGKTPAMKFRNIIAYRSLPNNQKFIAEYPKGLQLSSTSVIQPGMRMIVSIRSEDEVNQEDIEVLSAGTKILYVYGQLFYEDIFARPHYTRFCSYLHIDLSTVRACDIYNEAN